MNNLRAFMIVSYSPSNPNTFYWKPNTREWVADKQQGKIYRRQATAQAIAEDIGGSLLEITSIPPTIPTPSQALAKLRLEAIHYRDTGRGVEFLNKALEDAELALTHHL